MEQISITRDDFRRATHKATEKITNDPDLADKDPVLTLFIGVSGIRMGRIIESILFDEDSQDE